MRKPFERGRGFSIIPTPYALDEPRISECPASYVTQESLDLVQIAATLKSTTEYAALPGAIVDALRISSSETKAAEIAQDEAVANI